MEFCTNIKELIQELKNQNEDRIAYKYFRNGELKQISYGRLVQKIRRITEHIHENYGERKIFALFGDTTYEFMAVYLGILASNNVVVTLDKRLMQEQKEDIFISMGVQYIFHDSLSMLQYGQIKKKCNTVKEIFNIIEFVSNIKETTQTELISINDMDVAQYMFTSGSTGKSKIATFSYKNIASIAKIQNAPFAVEHDIVLSVLPIHHCFELATQIAELVCGSTICINDSMENFIENIRLFKPTLMNLVPAQLEELLRNFNQWAKRQGISKNGNELTSEEKKMFEDEFGGELQRIHCGGAATRPELAKQVAFYGIQVIAAFGMTEMCGHITNNTIMVQKPESVGIPFRDDVFIKIADDSEILLKGPNLMLGYYRMEREEFFTEDGFFKTGDLGRKDEDNHLYITGRKKNIILLNNGENVYPEELEALLGSIDGVRQVAIFEWENQIASLLFLEKSVSHSQIEHEIHKLNTKLADYKKITKIYYRETPFPMTTTSKIDRKQLLKEFKEANKTEYVPLKTEKEKYIANAIAEVLEYDEKIGALDNFFAMGGNSILALAVAANIGINAQLLYEKPIIRDLAKALEEQKRAVNEDEAYVNRLIQNAKYGVNEKPVQCILLTGATGFLGAHVLYELLKRKDAKITCLVRSKKKMEKVYQAYFEQTLPKNVKLINGDITKDNVGIPSDRYNKLMKEIDTVIHVAANVHHVGNEEEFMQTNYYGTKHMIQICKDSGAMLHYVSSYVSSGFAVVPIYSDVTEFTEKMLYIGQDYKQNVYAHTKYLSEVEIINERENGLRANIYRMGCLTSRRSDGVFQLNSRENGLQKRLRGLLKIGAILENTDWTKIDLTAVDECADAFVRLIYSGEYNHIYHMFNPNVISMKEVGEFCDKKIESVTKEEFREKVKNRLDDEEVAALSFYTDMLESSKPLHMDNSETVKALKKLGFTWGVSTKDYVKKFIG